MKLSLFILSLFIVTSCSSLPKYNEDFEYNDFSSYYLDSLSNFYTQKEDTYGIYLYRTDCEACNKNKNALLGYINEYDNSLRDFKVYLYNTERLRSENVTYIDGTNIERDEVKDLMINSNNSVNKIEGTVIKEVPSLYVISSGVLIDYIYDGTKPVEYLFDTPYSSLSYDIDFPSYNLNNLDDFYLKEEKKYYVYLFSLTCPYCNSIKGVINEYLSSLENNSSLLKLYYFNMMSSHSEKGAENRSKFIIPDDISSSREFTKYTEIMKEGKVNTLSNTYFKYIPSLYVIENGIFSDCIIGASAIPEYLN